MWSKELPDGYESRKCRNRIVPLCRGTGLDLSVCDEKIVKSAIGVGPKGSRDKNISLDLSANDSLRMFSDDYFDYVFDAHRLGNFVCTEAVLREWWRIIRYGGYLILYEQDKDYYPHVGTPGARLDRKKDLYWQDAWEIIKKFGNAELISHSRHNDSNEYSWQLVVRKKFSVLRKPYDFIKPLSDWGKKLFPRIKKTNKEALVIRYGALGDTCWLTPVLRKLKEDGYYVVVNISERGAPVLRENPFVDEFIIMRDATEIPYLELDQFWSQIGRRFERVVNLTKSVEGTLIRCEGDESFHWPHDMRHKECNYNFQDRTMELAGYPEAKGCLPELYFSDIEETLAKNFRENHRDKFVILWSLSGSAFHKIYPFAEYVAGDMCVTHKDDVQIITVGDELCKILEWQNSITTNRAGQWTVRQSFIMTKYADLVIGPDTGLLNAASAFDTPKIVFLSTNSVENLTKYWKNTTSLMPEDCECYPCHRLIVSNSCPRGTVAGTAPECTEHIKPELVKAAILKYYEQWKAQRAVRLNAKKVAAFTIADDPLTHRLAERVRRSFYKYHPDIPFYTYDPADEARILGNVRESARAIKSFEIRPRFMLHLLQDYDIVIYLDADTVVTSRLDEFLAGDYDVAGSLNLDITDQIGSMGDKFLNAGVGACTSIQFCEEWTDLMYRPTAGRSNQQYFNELAYSGRYRLKIVDEKDVYYNERSRPFWKNIVRNNGDLLVNDRKIKVLHWAGGVSRMEDKLSSKDFSPEVREFLNEVTQTTDFTDIEGAEVSQWSFA